MCFLMFQKQIHHFNHYFKLNRRCIHHLSTNHKIFTSDLKKRHTGRILTIEDDKLTRGIILKNGHLLLKQNISPPLWSCQILNTRCYSTDNPSTFIQNVEGIWRTIYNSSIVEKTQDSLIWLHENTGLPWWATIFLSAFILRSFVSLPISVYTHKLNLRLNNIRKHVTNIADNVALDVKHEAALKKWSEKYTRRVYNHKMTQLYKAKYTEQNCHPFKIALLPLLQIPPWVMLSISLRKFCAMLPNSNPTWIATYYEMTTGGFGWITNLTVPDQYLILSVALFTTNIALCEISHYMKPEAVRNTRLMKIVHNGFRILAVIMAFVSSYMPAGKVTKFNSANNSKTTQWKNDVSLNVLFKIILSCSIVLVYIALADLFSFMKNTSTGVTLFWISISGLTFGQLCLTESKQFKKLMKIPLEKTESTSLLSKLSFSKKKRNIDNVNKRLEKLSKLVPK